MRKTQLFIVILSVAEMVSAGCGSSLPEALVSINVAPPNASATVTSANNSVQFTATGSFAPLIPSGGAGTAGVNIVGSVDQTQKLTNAMWTSSAPVNVPINSNGLAVCAGITATPATITASAPGYKNGGYTTVSGTPTLSCN